MCCLKADRAPRGRGPAAAAAAAKAYAGPRGAALAALAFFLLVAFLSPVAAAGPPAAGEAARASSCVECHGSLDGELARPVQELPGSIHGRAGLSCHDCHGGDPARGHDGDAAAAMDRARGYRGAPARGDVPAFCGRCHSDERLMRRYNPRIPTDQEKAFWTSRHGERLAQGDPHVATCVGCHGSHAVRAVADAQSPVYPLNVPATCARCHASPDTMRASGLPTNQFEDYRAGVHGQALLERGDIGAPACNDCHGNHGAVPPGVSSVANVCGLCHPSPQELFEKSPHQDAFAALELGVCTTCHLNHRIERPTDALLGTEEGALCLRCHSEGDAGYAAAAAMKRAVAGLAVREEAARNRAEEAERKGVDLADTQLKLQEAQSQLVRARNTVHAFDVAALTPVVAVGDSLVKVAEGETRAAFREIRTRRLGLGFSSIIILLLVVGLLLKIRQLGPGAPTP